MTDKKLRDTLAQLRAEIEKLDSVSESDKQRLESLVTRIRNTADPDDAETGDDLQDILTETITKFEASHPRLTAIMNDIATTLSNMGI
jgi:cobalamin biosynthesis Mg chelatase CobN